MKLTITMKWNCNKNKGSLFYTELNKLNSIK